MSPTNATPIWSAPHNGIIGDASATAGAGQVNQLLGTHSEAVIYQGASILTPEGTGGTPWAYNLGAQDLDQPFTMSGTTIGRVAIPLLPVGAGADLLVSLCADNAGQPGTVITQTRIPASCIYQQAVVAGSGAQGSTQPPTSATGNPLATAAGAVLLYSGWQSTPWAPSASGASGSLSTAQLAQGGNYMVFAGGINTTTQNSVATVAVVSWAGPGAVSPVVSAPSLPQALTQGAFVATPDCLVYAGGVNVNGATNTVASAVYVASWNPATGAVGAWTVQAALPQALVDPGMACHAATDTVYVVGGSTNYAPESNFTSTVHYSTLSGQQLTNWTTGHPLPVAVADPSVAVVGDWLIVAGGFNAAGSAAVYYAPIDPVTGVPGTWTVGPAIPGGLYVENIPAVSDSGMAWAATFSISTGVIAQDVLTLSWDADGPGVWTHQVNPLTAFNSDQVAAMVTTGDGAYQLFNFQAFNAYITVDVTLAPMISVPLPATGLTNGATYHVLLQQRGGDLTDYLRTCDDAATFPGNPTGLTSPRSTYAWSALTSAHAVPLQVFDQTPGPQGQFPLHLWEDGGAKVTTFVSATTPDQRPLGICEATRQAVALNTNSGFEAGITPWTVTGGTGAQSSTQVFEGRYALQITPSGSAASVIAASEIMPCMPGQWCTADAHAWFTNAVTSNYSTSIAWYTAVSGGTQISVSSAPVSVPAATYTQAAQTLQAPAGAYGFQIQATLSGTPSASQSWYLDAVHGHATYVGPQNSTVTQIDYAGSYPWPWPGLGTTQLA